MVWYSNLFQNFPQFIVIHTVKGFGIVNKAGIVVFLELSCFFNDPADVGNLISDSSAFSKTSLNIWKFTVHVLLKPGLENFERYFTSMWGETNLDNILKSRETRDQIANICWIIEKAREFQKNIYFCFIDCDKAFDYVDHNKLKNSERDGNTRPPDLPLEKPVRRSGNNS